MLLKQEDEAIARIKDYFDSGGSYFPRVGGRNILICDLTGDWCWGGGGVDKYGEEQPNVSSSLNHQSPCGRGMCYKDARSPCCQQCD